MKTKSRVMLFIALFTVVALGGLSARAQSEREEFILNDPQVRTGVLQNGLTYYVMENDKPTGQAELRLVVKAGSSVEDEDQLGLAHFLEHMLFNGTEKYPKNELIEVLESFGMDFGPDINAYTSFEETAYRLSVRTDDSVQFDTGLDVLEQWAFHATITEEEYEKERGVIVEEWRRGRGAQARMMDQAYPVLFQDSRWAERMPIGDMDIIRNSPVEAARRYYEDWYRPDLMAVIVVGDVDADRVVQTIQSKFGGYENPASARNRPDYPMPHHDETLVSIAHDPEAVGSSVEFYIKYEPGPARLRSEVSGDLTEQLFYVILNQRLSELAQRENPPYIYGYSFSSPYSKGLALSGMVAAVPEEGVLGGLEALVAEAERVQRHGFTQSELDRAKSDVYAYFENYWNQRDDIESSQIVNSFLDAFLLGESYPSIDWQWEAVQEYLPQVTLEDVNNVAAKLLDDANRVILVSGPSVPAIEFLEETAVLDVMSELEAVDLEPWTDEVATGPLVSNPPAVDGSIVEKSLIEGTDIEEWILSNGAVVLIKATDNTADEILFRAVSVGGASLADDDDYMSAQFATDAVSTGGLGDFSAIDLQKVLAGNTATMSSYIRESSEGLSGSSSRADLETLLQLAYLHHTAPRRDEAAWNSLMGRLADYLKNRDASPMTLYQDLVWETIFDDHFRSRPLTVERLDEVELDTALDFHRERFAYGSDFTYIFVGDVDTTILQPLVEKWIGSLPSSSNMENWVDRGMRNVDGVQTVVLEAGMEPLSMVTQSWNGDWSGSFQERYSIQSLAAALEMKLQKIIREEYSGTYSVSVSPHISTEPANDYRIMVRFSSDPERVDELIGRVHDVVDQWRAELPEEKFAVDVAAAQRKSLKENMERNGWWLGQIAFVVSTGANHFDLLDRYTLYDSLDARALQDSARRYLDDSNYVEVVLKPDPLALKAAGEQAAEGAER